MEFKTEITIGQVPELLKTGRVIGVFGPSGHGKTATILQYAKDNDLTPVVINLAMELPENIGGIPKVEIDEETKTACFTRALDKALLPLLKTKGKGYLLVFDEINQGPPEVHNSLYGIMHPDPAQRNWNGHSLSECQIVALGNLADGSDGTVYLNELPTPLQKRMFLFKLKPSIKDSTDYLKKKYKNIPQVGKYIKVMTDAEINPRDIDQVLEIIQYEQSSLLLEAKLGSALTAKIYDIQKHVKTLDPAELLKNARKVYEQFKEDGEVLFGAETITTEDELKAKFEEFLSAEEITAVMKGE